MLPLHTPRSTLRRLAPDDLAAFRAYRGDPEVARYQGWEQMSDTRTLRFLTHMADAAPFPAGDWWQIGIEDRATRTLIGDLGLHLSLAGDEVELGITLARHAQGKGLAQEAVQAAFALIFAATDARRTVVITDAHNAPALALIARLGLPQVDTLHENGFAEPVFERRRPEADAPAS